VEGGGKPMVVLATAGQRHEAPMLARLMEAGAVKRQGRGRPRVRPDAVAGDKGYSYPSVRRYLRGRGIRAVIPSKSDQRRRPGFDRAAYRERNRVEIVCTQVTKPRLGAGLGGWDHVADLDLAVGHHHPVDQQLHQLAALLEAGLVKAHPELLQHRCHRLGDRTHLDQPLTLGRDLPLAC
jgi:Transposase DDE domain